MFVVPKNDCMTEGWGRGKYPISILRNNDPKPIELSTANVKTSFIVLMRVLIKRPGKKNKPRRFKYRFDGKPKVQFDEIRQSIARKVIRRSVVIATRRTGTSLLFALISEVCCAMLILSQIRFVYFWIKIRNFILQFLRFIF